MALSSLLPAVAYVGVLLAMNRLSHDRELLATAASGLMPGRLERAVLAWGVAFAVAVGVLAFAGGPWAAARFNVAYRTLLGTAKNRIAHRHWPAMPGLWAVHAACLGVVLLFAWRQRIVPV